MTFNLIWTSYYFILADRDIVYGVI